MSENVINLKNTLFSSNNTTYTINNFVSDNYNSQYYKNFKNQIENPLKFSIHNRRYLGNKFKLIKFISWVIENNCSNINTIGDIFAGTGIIGNFFNLNKKNIIVNDLLYSNYLIYQTFFSNEIINLNKIQEIINKLNQSKPTTENYFSKNFGNTFFTNENAKKIGYIREYIESITNLLNFREKAILITSLIYATDKVANTCGHYDAYRRKLDTTQKLTLLMPNINLKIDNSQNQIFNEDANNLVKKIKPDLIYIDPPYNSRQYGDTYHLLENLAHWNKPEVFGIAKKMKDRQKTKSKYCTINAPKAFRELIKNIKSKYILISYNNMAQKGSGRSNAKISSEEILEILNMKGKVSVFATDYKVFTTGKSNINNHKEFLYLCKIKE